MSAPIFDFVPIIQDTGAVHFRVIVIAGLSTKHGATSSAMGQLFGRMFPDIPVAGQVTVEVFNDMGRAAPARVLYGVSVAFGEYFDLIGDNQSGITARAIVDNGNHVVSDSILIPTFATDVDVLKDANAAARFPGYDPVYGLAEFHATAMRVLLASHLPQAVPHLYAGRNVSAFVPLRTARELPDIRDIRNPGALRQAQADLVKALSAQEREHLEEWRDIANLARQRFQGDLVSIREANPAPEIPDVTTESPGVGVVTQVSSWRRG